MQKSKLGLPAGIVAAIIYLTGLFGGITPTILVAGFVLLCEEENFIRRSAVKTLTILFLCSLVGVALNLVPNIIDIFRSMLGIFTIHFGTEFLDHINNIFTQTLQLAKTAILVLMTVLAFFGKSIDLKPLNKWADK